MCAGGVAQRWRRLEIESRQIVQQRRRGKFLAEILRTTEEQLQEYWIDQRITRGVSPPIQVRDSASVKVMVAANPGTIGYIPTDALDSTVKALRIEP